MKEFEADILAAIKDKCDNKLRPGLQNATEKQNRIDVITKQCWQEVAVTHHQAAEDRFKDLITCSPLCIYGLASTARLWAL